MSFNSVLVTLLFAQVDSLVQYGTDDLFRIARELAFAGNREQARTLLYKALEKSPSYADLRILLARTYAWDGNYSEARKELNIVLSEQPEYADALQAAIDMESWADDLQKALSLCNSALQYYSNDVEFLVKKAKLLSRLSREEEALVIISRIEEISPAHPMLLQLRASMATKGIQQSISINYSNDAFHHKEPQHITYVQYGRSFDFGSLIGRINHAYRRNASGWQFEADIYPKIMDGMYGYLNYGYSSTVHFPSQRIGAELFSSLPLSFEGSLGLRYLHFSPSTDVTIYTGSLGYYYGNYWISLRPYITPSSVISFSRSIGATIRRYFGDGGEYVFFRTSGGFSPDDNNYDPQFGQVYYFQAESYAIGGVYLLDPFSMFDASVGYTNQEVRAGSFEEFYSFSIGYKYKF